MWSGDYLRHFVCMPNANNANRIWVRLTCMEIWNCKQNTMKTKMCTVCNVHAVDRDQERHKKSANWSDFHFKSHTISRRLRCMRWFKMHQNWVCVCVSFCFMNWPEQLTFYRWQCCYCFIFHRRQKQCSKNGTLIQITFPASEKKHSGFFESMKNK